MAHQSLTLYLLKLATDPDELERYNAAEEDERRALLKAAGLTPPQCEALISADSGSITDQVTAELQSGPNPARGVHYTIQILLDLHPCKKHH